MILIKIEVARLIGGTNQLIEEQERLCLMVESWIIWRFKPVNWKRRTRFSTQDWSALIPLDTALKTASPGEEVVRETEQRETEEKKNFGHQSPPFKIANQLFKYRVFERESSNITN